MFENEMQHLHQLAGELPLIGDMTSEERLKRYWWIQSVIDTLARVDDLGGPHRATMTHLTEAIAALEQITPRPPFMQEMYENLRAWREGFAQEYRLDEVIYLDPRKNDVDTNYTEDVPMLYKNGRPYGSRITGFSRDNWREITHDLATDAAVMRQYKATDMLHTSDSDIVIVVDGKLEEMDLWDAIDNFVDQQIAARGLEVRATPMRICNVNNQYLYVFPHVSDTDAIAYLERRKSHA